MITARGLARASAVLAACLLVAPETSYAETSSTPAATSLNWAGYIASNAYYTGISALIQTPVATTDRQNAPAWVTSWIGIGGTVTSDLIQAGVDVETSGTQTAYSAWYELLPDTAQRTTLEIHPGDWVQVDIHERGPNLWEIRMRDGDQMVQLVLPYTSSHSSAEWIVEDPMSDRNLAPLASVTAANFSRMATIANGRLGIPTQVSALPMILIGSDGHARAVPSALGDHGDSFTVDHVAS